MPRKPASPKTDTAKKTTRKKKVEDAVVEVYYSCYDEVTVEIVIMLWAKITGARSDESIMSGVVKSWGKKLQTCYTVEKIIE